MKKIEYKNKVIRYTKINGYIFELENEFEDLKLIAVYCYNPEYGVKMHCISYEWEEQQELDNWLNREAENLIDIYKRLYED